MNSRTMNSHLRVTYRKIENMAKHPITEKIKKTAHPREGYEHSPQLVGGEQGVHCTVTVGIGRH